MRRWMLAGALSLLPTTGALADGYTYIPGLHRDPFAMPAQPPPPVDPVCNEALCQHELSEMKLTAIVTGQARPLAMIEDPATGEAFMVRTGARVGKHNGHITKIAADRVVVSEVIYTGDAPRVVERELRMNPTP